MKLAAIIRQPQVVEFLTENGFVNEAETVDSVLYNIGFKGERFPEYILVETLHKLLAAELVREIRANVTQCLAYESDLYRIGAY
jgi:hypothetical protein